VHADEKTHRYVAGEEVTLWTNKVGPYNNPQETFNYYTLPFCKSGRGAIERKFGSLGNVLMGNELAKSTLHHFKFLEDMPKTSYCEQTMTKQDIVKLVYAIQQNYWFEMYVDDLPLWGFIGKYEQQQSGKYEVNMYTHQKFVIGHNGDRIIFVHLTMMEPQALDPTVEEEKITFTYEVSYEDSTKSFHRRYEQYLDFNFFQHKIHWFSVFNSFMMVIFLVGLVSMILLRTLRKDYARYAKEDELDSLERDLNDEYGWKLVHGDVFRPPQYLMWLSAVYGIGIQFCVQCVVVVITVICGSLFMESGAVLNTVILSGALISFVGGYFSGSFYAQNDGKNWIKTMILSTAFFSRSLLCDPCCPQHHCLGAQQHDRNPFLLRLHAVGVVLLCDLPSLARRDHCWKELERSAQLPLQNQEDPKSSAVQEVVSDSSSHQHPGRLVALW
jgi:transmembrane 9 superfamily protein 3